MSYFDYIDDENSVNSDGDCCNCQCGCAMPSRKNDRLYSTKLFSEQTNNILKMYYSFCIHFQNMFPDDHLGSYFNQNSTKVKEKGEKNEDYDVRYNLRLLDYSCPDFEQEEIFLKQGCIVMNRYDYRWKKLVIGCGHRPIENDMDSVYSKRYSKDHVHNNCYTIDSDLCKNTDTIGVYGEQEFKHLPDEAFIEIHAEGVRIQPTPIFMHETARLLKEGGCFYSNYEPYYAKKNGKLVFCKRNENIYGVFLGMPDVFDWEWVREEYGPQHLKIGTGPNLLVCHHLKYKKPRQKIVCYDDDEMDTIFIKFTMINREITFKDLKSNYSVGSTKILFHIKRDGKEDLKFQYFPESENFIESDEHMACGHRIQVEHQHIFMCGINMLFTAERGKLTYLSFRTQPPCTFCHY